MGWHERMGELLTFAATVDGVAPAAVGLAQAGRETRGNVTVVALSKGLLPSRGEVVVGMVESGNRATKRRRGLKGIDGSASLVSSSRESRCSRKQVPTGHHDSRSELISRGRHIS